MLLDMPPKRGNQKPRPKGKLSTSYRLTEEALDLLDWLADRGGVTKSAVLERAVRELAQRERRKEGGAE